MHTTSYDYFFDTSHSIVLCHLPYNAQSMLVLWCEQSFVDLRKMAKYRAHVINSIILFDEVILRD